MFSDCVWLCTEDDDTYTYDRDPGWLKDLETAAAVDQLRDAVQASAADTGTVSSPAVVSLSLSLSGKLLHAVLNQFSI